MHVLSLFPGIGMLDLAFEMEGFTTYRGPDVIWGGDIRAFHPGAGMFSGVIGGPPCQSFSSLVHLVRANGNEPTFGNLIPEFERCVAEARPDWFLMENVPAAPEPVVAGYSMTPFMLDNSMLDDGTGWGQEQIRKRKFCFGMRGRAAPNLMRWIDLAVFVLPDAARTCTQETVNNSQEAKARIRSKAMFGDGHPTRQEERHGEPKRTRHEAVTGGHDKPPSKRIGNEKRYKLADALRLQGLPEDFLDHCPFTAAGKLKAVANGVPISMGRAVAKAIKSALT